MAHPLAVPELATIERTILSVSVTSHARIGLAADRLVEEMASVMTAFVVNGLVSEVIEFTALMARPPKPMPVVRPTPEFATGPSADCWAKLAARLAGCGATGDAGACQNRGRCDGHGASDFAESLSCRPCGNPS